MTTPYLKHGTPAGEFVNPVEGNGSRFTYTYVCHSYTNVSDATADTAAVAPVSYLSPTGETLVRQKYTPRIMGYDVIEVDVEYLPEDHRKTREPQEAGDYRINFDTTGGSAKITQSLETTDTDTADAADPAPDLDQAIGWDGKKVNGVEIVVPKLEFTVTAYYAPAVVTAAFMKSLARATGKTNNGVWLGFAAGELLFLGATGDVPLALVSAEARTKPVAVQLKLAASENITGLAVGAMSVNKKGFEYLWVRYKQVESGDGKNLIPNPRHAYVERVYDETDFAALFGFGGP